MVYANLSDAQLELFLREKVAAERRLTLDVMALLEEVERRRLFLSRGYGSLIEYCVKELKYSESSAFRRISAMRMAREVPETKQAIESGELNLSTVSQVHSFLRAEAKSDHKYSLEQKTALLQNMKDKSARETERTLVEMSPESVHKTPKVRAISGNKTRVTLDVPQNLFEKLEKIRNLLSHKFPDGSYVEIVEAIADIALEELDPAVAQGSTDVGAGVQQKLARPESAKKPTRYIAKSARADVWRKSESQCTYVSPKTGKRCEAKRFLEIDHKHPFSKGGQSTADNLQLLCASHNRFKSDA